jgi:hypothetical protein
MVALVFPAMSIAAPNHYAEAEAPGTTLSISFAAPLKEHKAAAITAWIQAVAHDVSSVYGRFPLPAVHVRVVPESGRSSKNSPVPFGRVTRRGGESVELFIDPDRPMADFYSDWTVTHEFSHLLLPRISWRQRWISEGFASYYQNVLMARAGHYSTEQAIRKLTEGFGRGRGSRPDLSPNEAAQEGIRQARYKIYWSGAAIALLADVELRERSMGRESLDLVLDRFQKCCLPSRANWSGTELFTKFDSLIDTPVFMPLYRQYADTPGFPDVSGVLPKRLLRDEIFVVRTSTN